jgi:hypothetical protein
MPLDPTTAVIFPLFSGGGAPATGLVPTFVAYEDFTGGTVTPPAITEIGLGMYGFTPAALDIANGTAYIIDGTVAANPRYSSGALQPGSDVTVDVAEVLALVTLLTNLDSGGWTIFTSGPDVNRMVFYEQDGTTVVAKYNLFNAAGQPDTENIIKRVYVPGPY